MVAGKTQTVPKLGPILGGGRYGPLQAPTKLYEETLQSTVRGYVAKEVRKQESYEDISITFIQSKEEKGGVGKLGVLKTRALAVISRAIEHVSLMTALPCLITNNGRQLRPHFSKAEIAFILNTCQKYEKADEALEAWGTSNCLDLEVQNAMSLPELSVGDPNMVTVINMIVTCPELVSRIGPPSKYATKTMLDFINLLHQLHARMVKKFSVNALETRRMEEQMKENYACLPDLRNNIGMLKREVRDQRNTLGPKLDKEWNKIKKTYQMIENVKEKCEKDKAAIVLKSEDMMLQAVQHSKIHQFELKQEAKEIEEKYDVVLEGNMKLEKMQQKKRDKLEMQLLAVLAKYDEHIGKKHAEYEVLCDSYDAEKAAVDQVKKMLEEQQEAYETLMEEREEERMRLFEEDAFNFLLNRSARRIQRAWRDYVDRKKARKRARLERARAKKQKALEKAERKAQGIGSVVEKKAKKKEKGKKGKGKKEVVAAASDFRGPDVIKALDTKFKGGVMEDLTEAKDEDFGKEVEVVL